jgi:hemoglobin-like flavoprotein
MPHDPLPIRTRAAAAGVLSPAAAARVRESYDELAPRMDAVVDRFYTTLFELHPLVRALFPPDMARQRAHLAAALAVIARNVDRLEMLESPLMGLGAQHMEYGARPEHYPALRDALVSALAEGLADRWTPQLQTDWLAALNYVVTVMLRGHALVVLNAAATLDPSRAGSGPGSAGIAPGRHP